MSDLDTIDANDTEAMSEKLLDLALNRPDFLIGSLAGLESLGASLAEEAEGWNEEQIKELGPGLLFATEFLLAIIDSARPLAEMATVFIALKGSLPESE